MIPKLQLALSLTLATGILSAGLALSAQYGERENLAFIEKILSFMNNNEECELPSFQEVDEMKKSLEELEEIWGTSYESKLTPDMKLARKTVLYQWDEFYRRMNDAVIIRSAAKRSFLCLIEDYQIEKFGKSICTAIKSDKKADTKRIFIKNPHVRYLQHLIDRKVPDQPEPNVSPPTDELIHTPIVEETSPHVVQETTPATDSEQTTDQQDEHRNVEDNGLNEAETMDPISDIPVPPASDTNPPHDVDANQDDTNQDEAGDQTSDEENSINDQAPSEPEPAPEHVPEPEPEPEAVPEPEPAPVPLYDEFGAEYVDTDFDDDDLDRLNKVPPKRWEEKEFRNFVWPDEAHDEPEEDYDPSIRELWAKFLKDPEMVAEFLRGDQPDPQQMTEPQPEETTTTTTTTTTSTTPEPEPEPTTTPAPLPPAPAPVVDDDDDEPVVRPPSRISAAALRKKKREYQRLMEIGARVEKASEKYGWEQYPPAIPGPKPSAKMNSIEVAVKQEEKTGASWRVLADNDNCKISYKKDALTNNKAARAVKKLFRKQNDEKSKKTLLIPYE